MTLALCSCATRHYQDRPVSAAAVAGGLEARSLDSAELKACANRRDAAPAWPPRKWNLDSLSAVAFCFNPSLEAARIRLDIAQAAVTTASQRPNPSLQLSLQKSLDPRAGDGAWTLGLALDMPVDIAGKRAHLMRAATHEQEAARRELAGMAWQVRAQLRTGLLAMWLATERAQLLRRQAALDDRIVQLLALRAAIGELALPDLVSYRVLRDQANGNAQAALEEGRQARLKVSALIGVRPSALADTDIELSAFDQSDGPAMAPPGQAVWRPALLGRADVRTALAQYDASQAMLQLEVAKQYPDLHLGAGYTLDQGVHKAGLIFSGLELPLFNRNEGPIAEAEARRHDAEIKVHRIVAMAFEEMDLASAAYQAAQTLVAQRTGQLDDARRKAAATQRALRAGEVDRWSQLNDQKYEIEANLALLEARFRLQQAAGQLENAMQQPFDAAAVPPPTSQAHE